MDARRLLAVAVAISAVVGLAGCASPDDSAAQFASWAASEEFVVSVDAHPEPGAAHSLSAHLVVDGAVEGDRLAALASAALAKAGALGVANPGINIIVGNAWGFSADEAGTHVGAINQLRDEPAFVGATVEYQALDPAAEDVGGVRGTVGSQAALRGANEALIAAVRDNGGDVDGVVIGASTADGAFGILGLGDTQPLAAIDLWQAISGRVVLVGAKASLVSGSLQRLDITVGSAEDEATAESIGAQFSDVELNVDVGSL